MREGQDYVKIEGNKLKDLKSILNDVCLTYIAPTVNTIVE